MEFKLGDTVGVRIPKPFKVTENVFSKVWFDKKGNAHIEELEDIVIVTLDTPEKVAAYNAKEGRGGVA